MEAYYYYCYYSPVRSSPWPFFPVSYSRFSQRTAAILRQNHIRWAETQDSHLFTAQFAGLRKEDIRVEVEDSKYMIIRTERPAVDDDDQHRSEFIKKFRLPEMVDVEGIIAKYEDGVLTVTVPRSVTLRRIRIRPDDVAERRNAAAPAA